MPGVPYYRLVKILDVNGVEQALSVEDGALCTRSYLQAIAEGDITNHTLWSKIGYAPGMTTNVNTDIWSYSLTQPVYIFPTTAMGMEELPLGLMLILVLSLEQIQCFIHTRIH